MSRRRRKRGRASPAHPCSCSTRLVGDGRSILGPGCARSALGRATPDRGRSRRRGAPEPTADARLHEPGLVDGRRRTEGRQIEDVVAQIVADPIAVPVRSSRRAPSETPPPRAPRGFSSAVRALQPDQQPAQVRGPPDTRPKQPATSFTTASNKATSPERPTRRDHHRRPGRQPRTDALTAVAVQGHTLGQRETPGSTTRAVIENSAKPLAVGANSDTRVTRCLLRPSRNQRLSDRSPAGSPFHIHGILRDSRTASPAACATESARREGR